MADLNTFRKINHTAISSWFMEIGALESRNTADDKSSKSPTEQGKEIGISTEIRTGMNGEYVAVVYSREAQQFIIDNIEAVISNANSKKTTYVENQGHKWFPEHKECLVDLFSKIVSVSEIAVTFKRSKEGIRAKLKKLGIIDNRSDTR